MATKKQTGKNKTEARTKTTKPRQPARGRPQATASQPDFASLLEDAVEEMKKITGVGKTAPPLPGASRIIYIHGIGNKPVASVLKCQWDTALFGFDLGERSRLCYWVNRERYPNPESGTCTTSDLSDGANTPAAMVFQRWMWTSRLGSIRKLTR